MRILGGWAFRGAVAACLCLVLTGCLSTGESEPPSPVFRPVISSSTAEVRQFLAQGEGGAKAKLVFIDRTLMEGSLCFLDFSEDPLPSVRVVAKARDARVPVISPDGEWVVYAVGEGAEAGSALSQRSSVYLVRMREDAQPVLIAADSACEPRFVQAAQGRLEILYSTLAPNLGWEGFGKTLKVAVDVSGEAPVKGIPEVVASDGSYTGGLSWDGRYLGGGGGHVALRDLHAPEARPDTISYQGYQSCNASISTSRIRGGALMYLNTFGQHPNLHGGKPWEEWQAILIGGLEGKLLKGFLYPAETRHSLETDPPSLAKVKWHHCEWSNHPYFAAATVNADRYFKSTDGYLNTMYQERVYLLNLKDSAYLEILRPDRVAYDAHVYRGFYWPYVWVEVPSAFTETPGWLDALP